jgi:hypothetical protein
MPHAGLALGAAGVSAAVGAVAVAVGGLQLAGRSHPDIWSNVWVVGAIAICGIGLLIAVVIFLLDLFGLHPRPQTEDHPAAPPSPGGDRNAGAAPPSAT